PGLQREFWVENLPENHTIVLRTMINSVPGRNYIQTNGEIQLTGPPAQPDSARLGLELLAIIRLKAHSPTRLTTWFIPNPVIPNPFDPTGKEPDPNSGFGLVEKSGCKTCHDENQNLTGPSFTAIAKKYKTGVLTNQTLAAKVLGGGTGVWGENVMIAHPHLKQIEAIKMVEWILSLDPDDQYGEWFSLPPADTTVKHPGDGEKLPGVHPSYDLSQARPEGFHPRVGGLDFLPDGRMVVCTWDGYVYLLGNLQQPDPEKIEVKTIAEGLAEPLGLKVVDGKIYVLQKQELTLLIDHNGDDVADEYANICNSWPVSANYHEFAFGLEYKDGFFYATLSSPLGKAEPHYPERGSAIKINGETGSYEVIANGFRTPNGLGMSPEGTLFVSDNQGNWLPANKIVEVRKGAFYGYRSRDPELMKDWEETAPMLWLQQADIANSPSQMIFSQDGPYTGQILVGDVTHGGVKRVFTEKVNGVSQGVTFRFTQGLESGVNRLRYGPDGAIYTGGVGAAGNWGQEGKDRYGLQRLRYNGKTTFEMLAVRAKADGMEIEFTEPLPEGSILSPEDFGIKQWRYVPTPAYGGPKTDEKTLEVSRIAISPERNKVRLYLGEMEKGHVIYLHLSPRIKSQFGQQLWSTECMVHAE
ncbi:MAG: cytochrome C, partial [Bacteroidia bacterium]